MIKINLLNSIYCVRHEYCFHGWDFTIYTNGLNQRIGWGYGGKFLGYWFR